MEGNSCLLDTHTARVDRLILETEEGNLATHTSINKMNYRSHYGLSVPKGGLQKAAGGHFTSDRRRGNGFKWLSTKKK